MSRRGLYAPEISGVIERILQRDVANRHRHVYRHVGPSRVVADFDVWRCTRCTKIVAKPRETS